MLCRTARLSNLSEKKSDNHSTAVFSLPKRAREISSNVIGNKSSDRELIFTFWYSGKRF